MPAGGLSYHDDISIIRISKCGGEANGKKGLAVWLQIVLVLILALLIVVVGYLFCVRIGLLAPVDPFCCVSVLDFEFEFSGTEN